MRFCESSSQFGYQASAMNSAAIFALLLRLVAQPVLHLEAQTVAAPPLQGESCLQYAVNCMESRLDACSVHKYRQYMSLIMDSSLATLDLRMSASEMRGSRNQTGGQTSSKHCYIEAVVERFSGKLLFIRFASDRSMFTGTLDEPSWRHFRDALKRFDSKNQGMQLLVDVDGAQTCKVWNPGLGSDLYMTFLARFTGRSSIEHMPWKRYSPHKYSYVLGNTSMASFRRMQGPVITSGVSLNITKLWLAAMWNPLAVWIYKCPETMTGPKGQPCNSEVNVYLYLRQWLNKSMMETQQGDFMHNEGWRNLFLTYDYPLIIMLGIVASFAAVQLTSLTCFGLVASYKLG